MCGTAVALQRAGLDTVMALKGTPNKNLLGTESTRCVNSSKNHDFFTFSHIFSRNAIFHDFQRTRSLHCVEIKIQTQAHMKTYAWLNIQKYTGSDRRKVSALRRKVFETYISESFCGYYVMNGMTSTQDEKAKQYLIILKNPYRN